MEHQEAAACLVVGEWEMEVVNLEGGSLAAALMDIQVVDQLPWEEAVQKNILEVGGLQILAAVLASSVERYLQAEDESPVVPKSSCHFFHSDNS